MLSLQRIQGISNGCEIYILNGVLEEVYIEQPGGFVDLEKSDISCRLHKTLYGLKQDPRAWYARLHNYLIKFGFEKNNDNNNLYLKTKKVKGSY